MKRRTRCLIGVSGLIMAASLMLSGVAGAQGYESEIGNLSAKMAQKIVNSGKRSIAVVDFTDLKGNVTELGRFIAEEFSVALLESSQGFEVLDRTHLQSILKEHKLSETGLIDPQTARKLGQFAGVDALVTGTITPLGESVRLAVKVLDVETANRPQARPIRGRGRARDRHDYAARRKRSVSGQSPRCGDRESHFRHVRQYSGDRRD